MSLDDFNSFLIENSGFSGKVLESFLDDSPQEGPTFFKPYHNKPDPFFRAVSIITAPVCLTILTVELALASIFIAFKSLVDLIKDGKEKARETIGVSAGCVLMMVGAVFAAIASPIVNTADLIGGGIATVSQYCNDDEGSYEPSF